MLKNQVLVILFIVCCVAISFNNSDIMVSILSKSKVKVCVVYPGFFSPISVEKSSDECYFMCQALSGALWNSLLNHGQ